MKSSQSFLLSNGFLRVCALLLCSASTVSLAEQSDDSAFFQQRSQHAYNAVFGLPVVAPRIVQSLEWQVALEHSNQFAGGVAGDETLLLDGESTRVSIRHRQRLASCWQLEATLPFVAHNEGVFDRAIDDWHQAFGLPDANRDQRDFDSLAYQYSDADGVRHNITRPESGLGDVQLAVQYAQGCGATADATKADPMWRAGIKLPTGDPDKLLGSGTADFFADWQSPIWHNGRRWHGGLALGVLINSKTQRFASQEDVVGYGSLGVQYAMFRKLRLIAQLDAHSPIYRSELRELGSSAINLAVGARYLHGSSYTFEFSISEDVAIDTTPDIVARLAVTFRPDETRRR